MSNCATLPHLIHIALTISCLYMIPLPKVINTQIPAKIYKYRPVQDLCSRAVDEQKMVIKILQRFIYLTVAIQGCRKQALLYRFLNH